LPRWPSYLLDARRSHRYLACEFSCDRADDEGIKNNSVKALLPGRGDLLSLARVGSWRVASALLAFGGCERNKSIYKAKWASKRTANFLLIRVGRRDDGR